MVGIRQASQGILGVLLLARHGDRLEFFQDPLTYTPSETTLTPLGTVQSNELGSFLRSTYLDPASPTFVQNISTDLVELDQIVVRADGGGEGGVIFNSVVALLAGLYPPTSDNKETLANGTTVTAALGGYQYIPVQSVDPNVDISLEGFTSCPNFDNHILQFYNSSVFKAKAQEAAPFLNALEPFLDGRPNNLENMFNIFDFVNVESIHNKTFHDELPLTLLAQAQALANFHEAGVFSDPSISGIGNVAIRTVLPSLFTFGQRIANSSDPLLFALQEISYKPLISLFNVTQADVQNPEIAGIVNYASVVALELRAGANGPQVNMRFKNGTDDANFKDLKLFGQDSVPFTTFISNLAPAAINTTGQWCQACSQSTLRGCAGCQV